MIDENKTIEDRDKNPILQKGIKVKLDFDIPRDVITRYANEMTVQRLGNEFVLSFFEVRVPIFPASTIPENIQEKVKVICVGSVVLSSEKIPNIINALQTQLNLTNTQVQEGGENDANARD